MLKERLKSERKNLHWTQQKLADALPTSRSNVANWENGYNEPSPDLLKKCADIFGCSTDYLLGRTDKRTIYEEWDEKYNIDKNELNQMEEISKNLTKEQKERLGLNTYVDDPTGQVITNNALFMEGLYDMGLLERNKQITDKQMEVILAFIDNNKLMIKTLMKEDDKNV